jgi:hypothetical protein
MASEVHTDDVGTRFLITIKDDGAVVDLTGATLKQLTFKKPDDSTIARTATAGGGGAELSGVMYYDSVAGDLDQTGKYKLQGKVSIPSGTYYTDIYSFNVNCNL